MLVSALGLTSSAVLEVVVVYGCEVRALILCSTGCVFSLLPCQELVFTSCLQCECRSGSALRSLMYVSRAMHGFRGRCTRRSSRRLHKGGAAHTNVCRSFHLRCQTRRKHLYKRSFPPRCMLQGAMLAQRAVRWCMTEDTCQAFRGGRRHARRDVEL